MKFSLEQTLYRMFLYQHEYLNKHANEQRPLVSCLHKGEFYLDSVLSQKVETAAVFVS